MTRAMLLVLIAFCASCATNPAEPLKPHASGSPLEGDPGGGSGGDGYTFELVPDGAFVNIRVAGPLVSKRAVGTFFEYQSLSGGCYLANAYAGELGGTIQWTQNGGVGVAQVGWAEPLPAANGDWASLRFTSSGGGGVVFVRLTSAGGYPFIMDGPGAVYPVSFYRDTLTFVVN